MSMFEEIIILLLGLLIFSFFLVACNEPSSNGGFCKYFDSHGNVKSPLLLVLALSILIMYDNNINNL
jgi:hypothetical protein